MKRWIALAMVLMAGDAFAQTRSRSPYIRAESTQFSLNIEVARRENGHESIVRDGDELHSGDAFIVNVTPTARVYLYVAFVSADGQPVLLWPSEGRTVEAEGGQRMRLPSAGNEIALDTHTGTETLLVIGSRDYLSTSDPALFAALRRAVGTALPTEPTNVTPQPPRGRQRAQTNDRPAGGQTTASAGLLVGWRTRGMLVRREGSSVNDSSNTLRVSADNDGVVVWKVRFRHT